MAKNSCQKKPNVLEILGTKVIQFWCYTKLVKTKNVPLNWYFSTKIFLERFGWFLTLKIDFENQILALFDGYFWPFNKSHEKTKSIFWSVQSYLQSKMFLSNSVDMMKNLHGFARGKKAQFDILFLSGRIHFSR